MKKTRILLLPDYTAEIAACTICLYSRANNLIPDGNFWSRVDDASKEQLLSFVRSSNVPDETARMTDLIMRRMLEHCLTREVLNTMRYMIAEDNGQPNTKDCMANRIIYPGHQVEIVNFSHYLGICKLAVVGWFLSSIMFSLEILWTYIRKSKRCETVSHHDSHHKRSLLIVRRMVIVTHNTRRSLVLSVKH